jgi:hypothetical protein
MTEITIACPATGKFVSTGSQMEALEFEKLGPKIFRMRCSACGAEHLWSRATAWLTETAKKSPAVSPDNSGLQTALEAVTKPRSSPPLQAALRPRERITAILERLLETNQTLSVTSNGKKNRT